LSFRFGTLRWMDAAHEPWKEPPDRRGVPAGAGAVITGPDASALDGLRAASATETTAQWFARGYIEIAREAGYDWDAIGEALGYRGPQVAEDLTKRTLTKTGSCANFVMGHVR
jgi:hypothetical protein